MEGEGVVWKGVRRRLRGVRRMDVARSRLEMPRMTRKARKTYMHQLRIVMVGFGQLGSTGKLDYRAGDSPEGYSVTVSKSVSWY